MDIKNLIATLFITLTGCSCSSTGPVRYFQDLSLGERRDSLLPAQHIQVRAQDKLSIIVHSKDPQLANLFNLPLVTYRVGMSGGMVHNTNQQVSLYTVDSKGEIDFPVLGKIQVEGLNREEIASYIKQKLLVSDLVKDPVVTVEFMNLGFSVLGEVARPGRFSLERDPITLLEALGMAGDLTIYGMRQEIQVLRTEAGRQFHYQVDISSGQHLFSSPVYYVKQDDVIYVPPNGVRQRQSTVNGNNVRSTSFWLSLTSLLTTITVLIVK